jgi:putative phosphoesterase
LISDIHGKLRPEVFDLLAGVDRILFAGDVERLELLDDLEAIAPLDAVWGNVDGREIRRWTAESVELELGGIHFAVTHGDNVAPQFDSLLKLYPTADVIVHGHSHVPRCDRRGSRWIVNPGAATKPRSGHPASVAIAQVDEGEIEIVHLSLSDGARFTP